MDMTVNRAEMLAAAKRAVNIAPVDSPIKELEGVLLEADATANALVISATNMEVSLKQKLRCEVKEEDAIVINARLLTEMLGKLAGELVRLRRKIGRSVLFVESESAAFAVPVRERTAFPRIEIPFMDDSVQVQGIPSLAKRTVFAVSDEQSKPLLRCVNLMFTKDGLRTAGSNGNCIVMAKGDDKSVGSVSLLLPAASLDKLARMCTDEDLFRVGTNGKSVVFVKENFLFTARLMEGKYIDTERLIRSLSNQFMVWTDMMDLRKALSSVTAIEQNGKVMIRFEGQKMKLCCNGKQGAASVSMDVVILTGRPDGEFWFHAGQLNDCLARLVGSVKLGIAQGGMLTLSTDDAFYMQNAVRAPSETTGKKAA